MQSVTISSKYQVVIPRKIREAMELKPGQKVHVIEYDGRIELIPERDIKSMRGFVKDMDSNIQREEDRF
jgi:AbrB family looped-hinge helix DNA binding protein